MVADIYSKLSTAGDGQAPVDLPSWESLDEEQQQKIMPILTRVALADGVSRQPEIENLTGEMLPVWLYLTALEMLGRRGRSADEEDFARWLHTNRDTLLKNTDQRSGGEDVGKTDEPTSDGAAAESQGEISPSERALTEDEIASAYHLFKVHQGPHLSFQTLFLDLLDNERKQAIVKNIWVYIDDPITDWSSLHLVQQGYSEKGTKAHERLRDSRKHWDTLTSNKKLEELATACVEILQSYPKGELPYKAMGTQDPLSSTLREIGAAAENNRISYLSEGAFREKSNEPGKEVVNVSGIEGILKNGELFVRSKDFENLDKESWLSAASIWSIKQVSGGETIFFQEQNYAIVFGDKSMNAYMREWLVNGIKRVLS